MTEEQGECIWSVSWSIVLTSCVSSSVVREAYTAAMYSMARLNRTGAKLMIKYGELSSPVC